MADLDDLGRQRHGRRSFHPEDVLGVAPAAFVVDGVAGAHIGADDEEIHRGGGKRGFVERVELFRHSVIAELLTVQVAGAQQILEAGIALVVAILGVVADGAADLMGLVVAAEHRAGRYADRAVHGDAVFHQNVQNTCGEHPPHGAAFQNQSGLHMVILLLVAVRGAFVTDRRALENGRSPQRPGPRGERFRGLLSVYSNFWRKQERK